MAAAAVRVLRLLGVGIGAGMLVAASSAGSVGASPVLADLADRWDPYVPALFQRHWITLGGYVILIGLGVLGVIRFSSTVTELVA